VIQSPVHCTAPHNPPPPTTTTTTTTILTPSPLNNILKDMEHLNTNSNILTRFAVTLASHTGQATPTPASLSLDCVCCWCAQTRQAAPRVQRVVLSHPKLLIMHVPQSMILQAASAQPNLHFIQQQHTPASLSLDCICCSVVFSNQISCWECSGLCWITQ
jgi:hypothetical protein